MSASQAQSKSKSKPQLPTATFHTLPHADGSATYAHAGYTIICSVNGPIEPQRRDERPEEAFVEVHVRPATGTGGPRDRTIESILHRTLPSLILTQSHPRTLIQIVLQILSLPSHSSSNAAPAHQSATPLPLLPHLLHAAVLGLVDANIPLRCTATAALVTVRSGAEGTVDNGDGEVVGMGIEELDGLTRRSSLHVFAFEGRGKGSGDQPGKGLGIGGTREGEEPGQGQEDGLLLVESEGEFDAESWVDAARMAEERCRGPGGLDEWMRSAIEGMVKDAGRWRG